VALSIIAIGISAIAVLFTVFWSIRSEKRHTREREQDRKIREKEREADAWAGREMVKPPQRWVENLERDSQRFNDPRQR
jgi:hypothetical protein